MKTNGRPVRVRVGMAVTIRVAQADRRHRSPVVVEVFAVEAHDHGVEDRHAEQREDARVLSQCLALREAHLSCRRKVDRHDVVRRVETRNVGAVLGTVPARCIADPFHLLVVARVALRTQRRRRRDAVPCHAVDSERRHSPELCAERGSEVGRCRPVLARQCAGRVGHVGVHTVVGPFGEHGGCGGFTDCDAGDLRRAVGQCCERDCALGVEAFSLVRKQVDQNVMRSGDRCGVRRRRGRRTDAPKIRLQEIRLIVADDRIHCFEHGQLGNRGNTYRSCRVGHAQRALFHNGGPVGDRVGARAGCAAHDDTCQHRGAERVRGSLAHGPTHSYISLPR